MLAKKDKRKKTSKTIFFSIILGLSTLLVVGFLIISNWKINQKRSEMTAEIESLAEQIRSLEAKKFELESDIDQSQNRAEKVAREDLDYKKQEEDVIVVKPPATTTKETEKEEKDFWQRIFEKIHF